MPPKKSLQQQQQPSSVYYISGFGSDLAKKKSVIASRMKTPTTTAASSSSVGAGRDSHIKDLESHFGPQNPTLSAKQQQQQQSSSLTSSSMAAGMSPSNSTTPFAHRSSKQSQRKEPATKRDFNDAPSTLVIPNKKSKMQLYRKDCDRSSYMEDLMKGSYGKKSISEIQNPDFTPKPDIAALSAKRSRTPSSCFKSKTTETRDSYIKASPQMSSDGVDVSPGKLDIGTASARRSKTPSAVFKSKSTVGDAHIRAIPKQLDVLVAYREMAGPK